MPDLNVYVIIVRISSIRFSFKNRTYIEKYGYILANFIIQQILYFFGSTIFSILNTFI